MIPTTIAGKPSSRIGLGCGRLDGGASSKTSRRIVEQARVLGICHFDLAPSYGMGLAEDVIGDVLAGDADITIATKVGQGRPPKPGFKIVARNLLRPLLRASPGLKRRLAQRVGERVPRSQFSHFDVERSFTESLQRLKRGSVDAVLLHQPSPDEITPELTSTMQQFIADGRATALGSGTGAGEVDLVRFGTIKQYRIDLKCDAKAGNDVILHGVLRHYPEPKGVLSPLQNSAFRELGRDAHDPSSWVGTLLTYAITRRPGSVLLISSNSPDQLRAACMAIDWSIASNPNDCNLAAMRRVLGV